MGMSGQFKAKFLNKPPRANINRWGCLLQYGAQALRAAGKLNEVKNHRREKEPSPTFNENI